MTNATYTKNRYIKTAYKGIVFLCLLYHILFSCLVIILHVPGLFIYHLCVCAFYVFMLRLVTMDIYRITTVLIHIEIITFILTNTVLLGWNAGFHAYLLALASLVYFNPFDNKKVMYIFSGMEAVLFFCLKIFTIYYSPILHMSSQMRDIFYLINYVGCFIVVVSGAALSKVSAETTEKRLVRKTRSLQNQADHDTLTHLWTRSYLTKQFQKIREKGMPFSVTMCDIDNFKGINDTYGHNCGDYILESIAGILKKNSPENSIVTRWGGEEFIVLLEDCDITKGKPLIEKIRKKVAETEFVYKEQVLRVTMTFGISTSMEHTELNNLIELADDRMYVGKQNGKNRVVDDSYVM
ncbi:MAG: GGDEF domain-containing protein [Lachnospiraceae bacterium]|nr:GGDEF domain-containing protein [Lachnospiraceae bacterium]